MNKAAFWRDKLDMVQHVEGGAFKEVYRSLHIFRREALTPQHTGNRNAATSIYFLLESGDFSAFHRIASDEIWHFYDGDTLSIYEITPAGVLKHHLLGLSVDEGALPQVIIPAGSWFGSVVEKENRFTLCGCTVAPGFDFADFELASRSSLIAGYPEHKEIITQLTRI